MQVRVKAIKKIDAGAGSLMGFADIVLDDMVTIKGLRIVNGQKGLFVSLPQQQSKKDQKWYPIVAIEKTEDGSGDQLFNDIRDAVLEAYENDKGGGYGQDRSQERPGAAPRQAAKPAPAREPGDEF